MARYGGGGGGYNNRRQQQPFFEMPLRVNINSGNDAVTAAEARLRSIVEQYVGDLGDEHRQAAEEAVAGITFTTDLAEAVADADLVVEAVPETLELKQGLYARLAAAAPERTIFATNSSTLLPSQLADATGRPEKFLALHFAMWRARKAA